MNRLPHRIDAIDGLRAIAVLAIILFHVRSAWLPGGFVGVDIFFAISGYVVCKSLLAARTDGFFRYIATFYAKRLLRIYPALITALLVTVFFARAFIPESYISETSNRTGLFAIFGLSNIQLISEVDGYFGAISDYNPYVHTWSLGVEEQFYVIFPVVFYGIRRGGAVAGRLEALLLPTLLIASLGYSAWETYHDPRWAFYSLTSRFWELAAGAILCLSHEKGRLLPGNRAASLAAAIGGLGALGVSLLFADERSFPFPWAIAPVFGTTCCIAGVVAPAAGNPLARLLSLKPVAYIGRISYSLYLWHWPVLVMLRWTVGMESPSMVALALAATGVLGVLSYNLIERTFQRFRPVLDRQLRVELNGEGDRRGASKTVFSAPTNAMVVAAGIATIFVSSRLYKRIDASSRLPLSVTMRAGKQPNPWRPITDGIIDGSPPRGECEGRWRGRSLFIIGDSHAGAIAEIASRIRKEEGASIFMHTLAGSRFVSLFTPQSDADRSRESRILNDLQAHARPGDVVLLASLRVQRLCDQWALCDIDAVVRVRDSEEAERRRRQAVQEGRDTIRRLRELGLVVVIQAPTPVFLAPPFRCSDWFNRMNPIGRRGFRIAKRFLLEHRSATMRSIREVQRAFPDVKVWDPFPILCPDDECSAFEGAKPLFFDGDHLSSYGNVKLYPDFHRFLEAIWSAPAIDPVDETPIELKPIESAGT